MGNWGSFTTTNSKWSSFTVLISVFFWGTPCRKGQGGSFSCQGDHGNVYMSDLYISINHSNHSVLNKRCGTEKENIYSYMFLLFFNLST